jgi:type IV pilus assembly protein PilW
MSSLAIRQEGKTAMILKNLGRQRKQEQGFTLVELLVAIAMLGIVMAAIYSTYKSQQDSYVAQEQVAEMQQNLRASLYQMARDLRMAGFNPQRSPNVGGFVTQLPDDGGGTTTTDAITIALTIDQDADGTIDLDDNNEQIAYRLDAANNRLEKFWVSTDTWQTVADNIDAVDFVYLDPSGTDITAQVIATPTTIYPSTNLPYIDSIRSVEISLVARTGRVDRSFPGTPAYNNQQGIEILAAQPDNRRRRLLTTTILCRNMGT